MRSVITYVALIILIGLVCVNVDALTTTQLSMWMLIMIADMVILCLCGIRKPKYPRVIGKIDIETIEKERRERIQRRSFNSYNWGQSENIEEEEF